MFFRQLAKIEAITVIALTLCALAVGAYLAVEVTLSPSDLFKPSGAFTAGFLATLTFGTLPALLLGAPAYLALVLHGRASWFAVVGLGAILGTPLFYLSVAVGVIAMVCGAAEAAMTYLGSQRWLSAAGSKQIR